MTRQHTTGWPQDQTETELIRNDLLANGWPPGPALEMAILIELDPVARQFMVSYDNLRHAAEHALEIGFEAFREGVAQDAS